MTVDHLLTDKSLPKPARNYLISCKQESKSPRTIEAYLMVLSRFSRDVPGDVLSAHDIRLFLLSLLESGLKPSTAHIHYRSLKTFFKWLVLEEYIAKSPMANIKPPKVERPVTLPFSCWISG